MRALLPLAAALAGCATVDHAALARDLYVRSQTEAAEGELGPALGLLFALKSPQLAPYRPRGADALERQLHARTCTTSARHWIEEPPAGDDLYVWDFDGTYWLDELPGFRERVSSECPKR